MTSKEYKIIRHNERTQKAIASRQLNSLAYKMLCFNLAKFENAKRTQAQRTAYFDKVNMLMNIHLTIDPIIIAKANALA